MVGSVGNGLANIVDKPEPLPEEIVDPLAAELTSPEGTGEREVESNGGIEKKKREIVLGRNVHTMCFSVVEPEADDEQTGEREAYMASVLARYRRSLVERTKHHLGYPYNLDFDYGALAQLQHFSINNLGDPFIESNYGVHSRQFEVGVLDWFARLWELEKHEYWGYITNCGTEGNLHGILVGREVFPDGILYASKESHYSVFKAARMYRPLTLATTSRAPRSRLVSESRSDCGGSMDGGGGGGAVGPAGGVGGGGGGGGGADVELVCKTLQFEHKLFYFDLKENPRGKYLKISEKTAANRSTIIVPSGGVGWFLELFNYYIETDEREIVSKELRLDSKVFFFDAGVNKRGRFLKISEASVNRNRSTIIVPAGSSGEEGWELFRNLLAEINEVVTPSFYPVANQHIDAPERLTGLSDDVGAGFISGHGAQPASGSELGVDRLVDLAPQDEIGNMGGMSKVIRADQKRFFFDLGSNNRGHYLRISEVAGADRSSIILPLSGLKQFHEMLGHFVEVTKDRLEGMTGANVRNVENPQR